MRRFTEAVLFRVACILLPALFVNGQHALQPTVQYDTGQQDAVIRGLLVPRQYYCLPGYSICEVTRCCPNGWHCCVDGNCCSPETYCVLGTNGIIGCCPNGELCSGPAGNPSTIHQTQTVQQTATTHFVTSTTINRATTSTLIPSSIFTTTFTTLLGGPTQTVGAQIIQVSVLDVNITWSASWVEQTSLCGSSITSKTTSTGGSTFTYLFQYSVGYYYYLNFVNYNTMWELFVNGESKSIYYSDSTENCTYLESYNQALTTPPSGSQNLTVVVHGLDSVEGDGSQSWSLAFNELLIMEQNSLLSTTGTLKSLPPKSAGPSSTDLPVFFSPAKRAQPHRPLLVIGSVLLVVLYCV